MRTSTVLIDESNVTEIPYFVFAMVMHLISYSQAKRAYQWHRNGIQESVVVNVVNCLTCQSKACECLYTLPKQSTNTNSLYPISKHPLSRYSLLYTTVHCTEYSTYTYIRAYRHKHKQRTQYDYQIQLDFYFTHSPLWFIFACCCGNVVDCTEYTDCQMDDEQFTYTSTTRRRYENRHTADTQKPPHSSLTGDTVSPTQKNVNKQNEHISLGLLSTG